MFRPWFGFVSYLRYKLGSGLSINANVYGVILRHHGSVHFFGPSKKSQVCKTFDSDGKSRYRCLGRKLNFIKFYDNLQTFIRVWKYLRIFLWQQILTDFGLLLGCIRLIIELFVNFFFEIVNFFDILQCWKDIKKLHPPKFRIYVKKIRKK